MTHGPDRGELRFRLIFSLVGLAVLVGAVVFRGLGGFAWTEVVLISAAFFGLSAAHAARALRRMNRQESGQPAPQPDKTGKPSA